MKTGPSDLFRLQWISNHSSVPLQVQNVYVAVLLVEKQSTWTFWWGIQLNLSQEPAFEVVEAETVVPTICDQHVPHAVNSEPRSGSGPGCFKDPAGLAVDSMGNMLIADSRNHRLCLHDFKGRFLTEVKLDPPPKRPSGLLLDQENGDIYILNLQGDAAVIRYSLQAE